MFKTEGRDFIGYGPTPPDFVWPGGARLAVNLVINYEEGAERNGADGDLEREPLVEAKYEVPIGERELFTESTFEYGSRVGIWNILDALDEREMTASVFAAAVAMQRNPDVTDAIIERKFDVVGHGYRWLPHTGMNRAQETKHISDCVTELEALCDVKIKGWFTRPPNTINTRSILQEQGLIYDSGSVSDDLPYFERVNDAPFLIVPYSLDVNDTKFFKGQFFTGRDFADYAIDALSVMRAQAKKSPRMLSIGLHPRIIGRPARLSGLLRVLDELQKYDDIWLTGRNAIADFWLQHFPPDPLDPNSDHS